MANNFRAFRATPADLEIISKIQAQYSQPWNPVTVSQALRIALQVWDTNRQTAEEFNRNFLHEASNE